MTSHQVSLAELPFSGTAHRFDGDRFGAGAISFFVSDGHPGSGPKLHRHPYAEVFLVQEGSLTFTVGDETVVAEAGQIVVVPAGTPHKFVTNGPGRARHLDIHAAGRMSTEWLEE